MRAEEMSSNVPSCLEGKVCQYSLRVFGSHGLPGGVEEFKESGELDRTDVPIFGEPVGTVFRPLQPSQYRGCGKRLFDLKHLAFDCDFDHL